MPKEHKVIVIPGLGDDTKKLEWAVRNWKSYGLKPVVYSVGWRDGENSFEPKLHRLIEAIDGFIENGDSVSLVGTSAGGSAVLNAFMERKDSINKVVNVCGRLRVGPISGFRSFALKTRSSMAFADSVRLCERGLNSLSEVDLKKVMTVRPMFGDELVPSETTILHGALNTKVPTPEHMLSIGAALTVFSSPIINFLKGTN